jgi:hypothetical protein
MGPGGRRSCGQLFIEHAVQQFGAAVVFHVLADRLTSHLLHRPVLKFGASAQRVGLVVGKPESHRHAIMVSRLIPRGRG